MLRFARKDVWVSPWIGQPGDLLEPWLFLPCLFMFMWPAALLQRTLLGTGVVLILTIILTAVIFSAFCVVVVWSQGKDEGRTA